MPNAFLILDTSIQRAVSVEVSASSHNSSEFSTMMASSSMAHLVHTNHVVHSAKMWQNELRSESLDVGHKSVDRFRVMNEYLLNYRQHGNHTGSSPYPFFRVLTTYPIHNVETLATVVMNPLDDCFCILWYNSNSNGTKMFKCMSSEKEELDFQLTKR